MIKKYKNFEEAERDIWVFTPDEGYYKNTFSLLRSCLLKKIAKQFPRGIFKYKTHEEAQKHLEEIITNQSEE